MIWCRMPCDIVWCLVIKYFFDWGSDVWSPDTHWTRVTESHPDGVISTLPGHPIRLGGWNIEVSIFNIFQSLKSGCFLDFSAVWIWSDMMHVFGRSKVFQSEVGWCWMTLQVEISSGGRTYPTSRCPWSVFCAGWHTRQWSLAAFWVSQCRLAMRSLQSINHP